MPAAGSFSPGEGFVEHMHTVECFTGMRLHFMLFQFHRHGTCSCGDYALP